MYRQSFRISDVGITVASHTAEQSVRVDEAMVSLFDSIRLADGPPVLLDFGQDASSLQRPQGTLLFASHGLSVFRTGEGYGIRSGASGLDINLTNGCARGYLDEAFWEMPHQCRRVFFFFPLLVLFGRYGLYGIHASGLERDNAGYLVAGNSGQGKTTLTLALLRAGWNYVSDDTVMLSAGEGLLEARSFRRGFGCDAATMERFPELGRGSQGLEGREGKVLVDAAAVYPGRHRKRCTPRVLVFTEIVDAPASRLTPLDATSAFARLVRHSPIAWWSPADASRHMNALRALVAGTTSYRLLAGADVMRDPEAVSRALAGASGVDHA